MSLCDFLLSKMPGPCPAYTHTESDKDLCLAPFVSHARIQEFSSGYFNKVKWSISKKSIIFQGPRGGPTFSRGGPTFSRVGPIAYSL